MQNSLQYQKPTLRTNCFGKLLLTQKLFIVDYMFLKYSCFSSLYQKGVYLTKNHLHSIIQSLEPAWRVSFEIHPKGVHYGWENIIHFTTGGNVGVDGNRIPAVWFHSGSTRLYICSSLNGNSNSCYSSKTIPPNRYIEVEIVQRQITHRRGNSYIYTIGIAGVTVFRAVNTRARYYRNVKVYCADPWHYAGKAKIRNFIYHNLDHGMYVKCARKIKWLIPSWHSLNFEHKFLQNLFWYKKVKKKINLNKTLDQIPLQYVRKKVPLQYPWHWC